MVDHLKAKTSYISIWKTVQHIPRGKVASYGQIADLSGLPGRARLVGKALSEVPKNGWQGRTVPWHRVINAQGKISFPLNSAASDKQIALLQEEQVVVQGSHIKLATYLWQPDLAELLVKLEF